MSALSTLAGRLATRRTLLLDITLAAGSTMVAVLLGHEYLGDWRSMDATGYLLIVAANLPAAFRRRAPVAILTWCAGAWTLSIAVGYWPALNAYGTFLSLYAVALLRSRRVALTATGCAALIWVFAGLLAANSSMPSVLAQTVLFNGITWQMGTSARKLEQRNRQLAQLTEQLRQEQADRAQRAVVEERIRIAQELHDIVAHHMSVISVQAGMAGYVFDSDRPTARTALAVIADNSREAQEELRRILSLLRTSATPADGDPARPPAPGVGRLGELVDRMRTAGVHTELRVDGKPQPLPPGLDACTYRVVQESLTNVLKHAGPATATVTLEYAHQRFTVRVTDDGGAARPAEPAFAALAPPGHGVLGMRERARVYGGTLTAGHRDEAGFQVILVLPLP
ncbi:sensor histidine kinase [Catellatospora methionotrophica]|uniref:sensor histidine kinase n=1 Tax=Catellatospora methionotrophica TaxID=121620 RepID=UPI0033C6864F